MKLLVKNGMIATESQVFRGDILIEDEKIKSIGTVLEEEDAERHVIHDRRCTATGCCHRSIIKIIHCTILSCLQIHMRMYVHTPPGSHICL